MDHAEAWAMVQTMARMQESYNTEVHADWRGQQYPFYRAVWVECAELLEHYGWKWWKHQRPDLDQVKLEIVDIWHFGLSDLLRAGELEPELAGHLLAAAPADDPTDAERFRLSIERLARETLLAQHFVLEPFLEVLAALPLSFDELFRLYVGKNVLNGFRLAHGYKAGTYPKRWGGREDNEHLVELLDGLVCRPEDVPDALYAALTERFQSLRNS